MLDRSNNGHEKSTQLIPAPPNGADEFDLVIEQGEAKGIALEAIEKGLTALWQSAAKPRPGETEQPVMRACVFNLIISIRDEEQLPDVTETITKLTWSYPCRAIVLVCKPEEAETSTEAFISAHCQLPTGTGKKVCCEQITIIGKGEAANGLWSMVLPLIVPDLPVILWWPGDPCVEEALFERLLDTADRVIVDSRAFVKPGVTFAHLATLSRGEYSATAFADLSWSRLTAWRSLIAQFFDQTRYRIYLENIDAIEIQYEAPDDYKYPNFSEALLLVGWLSTLLGWQPAFNIQRKGANAKLILNQKGAPLTVNLFGHNDRVDDLGGITQVKLTASMPALDDEEGRSASFTVKLTEDYERASSTIEEEGMATVVRSALFPKRDRTELLCEDLTVVRRDAIYEAALELAGQFSQK